MNLYTGEFSEPFDLYARLLDMGAEIDNHESDLYVRETPAVFAVVRASGLPWSTFKDARTGGTWLDVPFAFSPWWAARARREG